MQMIIVEVAVCLHSHVTLMVQFQKFCPNLGKNLKNEVISYTFLQFDTGD